MNYKKNLFFIAKCLTISLEEKNRDEIEKQLKSTSIDWDAVVKVSTAHYVFPALYCNLKRADFLHYLPQELVSYMQHITNINRERNKQIILQANELNNVLFPELETTLSGPPLVSALSTRLEKAISIDNGIMHMIGLANIPMIVLFGPTNSKKFAPKINKIDILDSNLIYNSSDISKITENDVLNLII